ncbi:MAG: hypothetical protein ACI32F_07175 [Allobaculum sp.]
MDYLHNELHRVLDEQRLNEILNLTFQVMDSNYRALSAQASSMPNVRVYQDLLDYCNDQVVQYIHNYDNLMNVLLAPTNIQPVYFSIVESDAFGELCTEEFRGFPRIVAMALLAGTEAAAANCAMQVLKNENDELIAYLDGLVDVYQGYLADALAYGKGEKKSVFFTGKKD